MTCCRGDAFRVTTRSFPVLILFGTDRVRGSMVWNASPRPASDRHNGVTLRRKGRATHSTISRVEAGGPGNAASRERASCCTECIYVIFRVN